MNNQIRIAKLSDDNRDYPSGYRWVVLAPVWMMAEIDIRGHKSRNLINAIRFATSIVNKGEMDLCQFSHTDPIIENIPVDIDTMSGFLSLIIQLIDDRENFPWGDYLE